ncbi:MAG: right-handed parallel beta-helix repeat-containing protein [Candidatus Schekmanbacteria bacterium]|nr:right-handed parallel beta-helix repeat-containing protein [Candidatus Schekmanbacteria bacterium]
MSDLFRRGTLARSPALLLAGLVLLVPSGPAHSATYFVDLAHPAASDSNPGTEALPWLTIQHAADSLAGGDTLYVKAGTYAEQVIVERSGAPGAEIVLAAYPGHVVTIDGATLSLPEWTGLVFVNRSNHVRVAGFEVRNAGPNGTNTGIQVEDSTDIVIAKNHTADTASSGILVWSSRNVLIEDNEVERAMTAADASRNECITVGRSSQFEVRRNHVHDVIPPRGEGICLKDGSSFGSAHHNHVHDVEGVGIYIDAWGEPEAPATHDIDAYANRIHDIRGGGIVLAAEIGGTLERVRVYNNVSYSNRDLGLELSGCCLGPNHPFNDIQIVNNSFWGNGFPDWGGGLAVGNPQITGLLIRNNASAGNNSFELDAESVDLGGATIDHNLIDGWDGYPGELCGTDCQLGNPQWVDPAAGDFHLQAGSPAIDSGSGDAAPADDLDGNVRPAGVGIDIGAHEYGAVSVPASLTPALAVLLILSSAGLKPHLSSWSLARACARQSGRMARQREHLGGEWVAAGGSGELRPDRPYLPQIRHLRRF